MLQHRSILEVIAWLPARDVAKTASQVCRTWMRIADEDEVWSALAEANGLVLRAEHVSKKQSFQEVFEQQLMLPIVTPDSLTLFNCISQKRNVKALSTRIAVDSNSFLLFLGDSSLLVCGGGRSWSSAFRLWPSGLVQTLPDMLYGRKAPGATLCCKEAYVFGGLNQLTSEKMPEDLGAWSPLPNMPVERHEFTPCAHATSIYICGGRNEGLVFDTTTSRYSSLNLQIYPRGFCALEGCELLFVTSSEFLTYNLEKKTYFKQEHSQWGYGGICCRPVLHEGAVWVTLSKTVLRLDRVSFVTRIFEP